MNATIAVQFMKNRIVTLGLASLVAVAVAGTAVPSTQVLTSASGGAVADTAAAPGTADRFESEAASRFLPARIGGGTFDHKYAVADGRLTRTGQYMTDDSNVTVPFDPDASFYGDGVRVTMGIPARVGGAMPESASLLLLGTGLLLSARQYRRRANARKQ